MRDTASMVGEDLGDARLSNANEERIFVSIRVRPLNEKERARHDVSEWDCIAGNTIRFKNSVAERSTSVDAYTFDRAFGDVCSTHQVYEEGIKEVALSVVNGINSSIFAYGQTSSGKTYTMTGITEYAVKDIYDYINMHREREFVLKFSAMEIYNEAVRDLLSTDSAPLRLLDDPEKGTVVEKLTEETLTEWSDLQTFLSICAAERTTEETSMNESSSRSHQIIRLTVESSPSHYGGAASSGILVASVNFVDLAGSERASQALTAGARLREGSHINRSLLTLGTVIRKLSKERNGHIPYRESKLTRILHNSLGGNARTAMVCTISPARSHVEQSRNTLLFANCAKQVATNAQVNVIMSDKILVQRLQQELARMQNELKNFAPNSVLLERELLINQMNEQIKELTRQRDAFQSRVENLLHTRGKVQLLRIDEDSTSISSGAADNLLPDRDFKTGGTSENPDGPTSVVSCDDENLQQHEDPEYNFFLDGNTPKLDVPDSDQGWDVRASRADAESEDNCKEVRCIEIEEVSTDCQRDVISSFPDSEEREGIPPTREVKNGDAELSSRKADGKLSHVAVDNIPDALQQKVQELQRIIDHLVGLSGKSNGLSSESHLANSISVRFSRSKSCRPNLGARSPPEFSKVDQKPQPPSQFDRPNTSPPKFDTLEQETNAAAARVENECSPSSVSVLDKLSEPKLHAKEEKWSRNHCRTPEMDALGEAESAMDSDAEDTTSVLNFVVKMNAKTKAPQLKADFENLVVLAKTSGSNYGNDTAENINLNELPMPAGLPPYELERQQRDIIELWHACNVPLVHRSYFLLLLKGEHPDSVYLNVELRRLSFIKEAFSSGIKFLGEDGQDISPDSSLKALNRERKMLSKQVHKKFSSKERNGLYQNWCIELKTKHRSIQLAWRIWSNTDLFHVRESALLVAKLVGLVQSDEAPKTTLGFSFGRRKSKKSQIWKDTMSTVL